MTHTSKPRIGLALAGGGPLGAIYEIGALCALEDALPSLDLRQLEGYVGVSAGGFIAAALANGMLPRQLVDAFILNRGPRSDQFAPALLFKPAFAEWARALSQTPGVIYDMLTQVGWKKRSISFAIEQMGRLLPTGIFSNDAIHEQIQKQFSVRGRTNDFRKLGKRLVLVATNLDTGEATPFGMPGYEDIPISKAIQASAALPGLFPPVEINGHHYVDGALKKTVHATVLLDEGLDLLIVLNPLVPFQSEAGGPTGALDGETTIPRLIDGGLPLVLSQMLRSLIHSRLELGLRAYRRSHPGTDIVLLEPKRQDTALFAANTFSYAQRRVLAEHAYQRTRKQLLERRIHLEAVLGRHGVQLDVDALSDPDKTLLPTDAHHGRHGTAMAIRKLRRTLNTLEKQAESQSAQ